MEPNKFFLIIVVIIILGAATAVGIDALTTDKEPTEYNNAEYTIFIGSASFSVGYYANDYTYEDEMIKFISLEDSTEVTSSKAQVYKIERNK